MISDQVNKLSYQMRLFGIQQAFARRSQEALAQHLPPLEFLHLLLQDESLSRQDRLAKRLVSRAKFRRNADLEDWDQTFDRGVSKAKLKELAQLSFYHNRENLLLIGKTGCGKTQLAIALGRRLCQQGIATRFLLVNMLFEEIRAERAAGRYLAYLKNLNRLQVLVLDDLGQRSYNHEEATTLLDLLEERYEKGSSIITSQVDPQGWSTLFEDPVSGEAIVDRLRHPSQTLTIKGDSYRPKLEQQKRKNS